VAWNEGISSAPVVENKVLIVSDEAFQDINQTSCGTYRVSSSYLLSHPKDPMPDLRDEMMSTIFPVPPATAPTLARLGESCPRD